MTAAIDLPHDILAPPAPSWWPPAPGWWLLLAVAALAVAGIGGWWWRRRRRHRAVARLFDAALAAQADPVRRIAAMSELLRRAARLRDPHADRLAGEDWLRFLDAGDPAAPFSAGPGRALLEAGFRRHAHGVDVDALQRLARARYLAWTRGAR